VFLDMDQRIQVHQLRQFLQTTTLTSEEGLRTLLEHHLQKAQRSDSDRDKTDFLLVQFSRIARLRGWKTLTLTWNTSRKCWSR